MKLNKVLALALSGVMAVSMLAGCSGKPSNGDEENNQGNTTVDTTVASVLNEEQAATDNKVKIDFTYSSSLENALEKALTEFGASVKPVNVEDRVAEILNVDDVTIDKFYGYDGQTGGTNTVGEQTAVVVIRKSGLTDTGVAKEMYTTMKDKLAKLTPDWENRTIAKSSGASTTLVKLLWLRLQLRLRPILIWLLLLLAILPRLWPTNLDHRNTYYKYDVTRAGRASAAS